MDDFESVVEEYDNKYEEVERETPGNGDAVQYEEIVTITTIV